MKNGTIWVIAGGAALYILWRKAQAIGNLNFIPRGVNVNGNGLILSLGIQNPSSSPLSLTSFVGNISVNGAPVGNVTSFQPIIINPNSETQVPITVSANVFGALASILNTINNGFSVQNAEIVLDGQANIGTVLYPVRLKFA